jgi:DNA invertase Pin-like site-specific DNA recombinase
LPRIVEGKYLKELYALHERKGALEVDRKGLERLCEDCRPGYLCKETALTVYCLESVF